MKWKGIFFGVSITVTKDNMKNITEDVFMHNLYQKGCKVVFLVEYVPVNEATKELAPCEEERSYLESILQSLRGGYEDMIFFHINPNGGTEPCPFSPFSDTNLRDNSLLDALHSP